MATPGKLGVEIETKSNPDKLWAALQDSNKIFPKMYPDSIKSIEILEGDGQSPGSIRLVKSIQGHSVMTTAKERIEAVDEANQTISYSVIDGDLMSLYKSFKVTMVLGPKGEGTHVKWSCEFEKAKEDIPDPDLFKEFAIRTFQSLDAYLLKA